MDLLDEFDKEEDNDLEDNLAKQNATVEYYYKVIVDKHYPLLKKLNQLERLNDMFEMDARRFGLTEDGGN